MHIKSQREIINETSKRFNTLVSSGVKNEIAYKFYLASLRIDLKKCNHQTAAKV